MSLQTEVEIRCYNPLIKVIARHWGNDDEFVVRKSAEENPHLIYFFADHRYLII